MRRYIVAAAALAMVFGFAPNALAEKPDQTGNENRPCLLVVDHPLCDDDGNFLPPGLGGPNPGCEHAPEGKNPNCPSGEEPPPEEPEEPEEPVTECPPGGAVTDIGFQVTSAIRDGGGEALADPLDGVLCAVHDLTGL